MNGSDAGSVGRGDGGSFFGFGEVGSLRGDGDSRPPFVGLLGSGAFVDLLGPVARGGCPSFAFLERDGRRGSLAFGGSVAARGRFGGGGVVSSGEKAGSFSLQ